MQQARSVFGVVLALTIACALAACGGKTEDDSSDGADPAVPSTTDGKTPQPDSGRGNTALGPCMPGFNPADEPDHACDWIAEGLCYENKIAACSCVCPRNSKNSTCVSGFFQENGRTEVSCF